MHRKGTKTTEECIALGFGVKCGNCDHSNSGACTYQHSGPELDKVLEDTEMWHATSPKGKFLCPSVPSIF